MRVFYIGVVVVRSRGWRGQSGERKGQGEEEREEQAKRTSSKDVLKAHVKRRVGVRGKGISVLAGDVSRSAVVVSDCVFDLQHERKPCQLLCSFITDNRTER